MKKHFRKLTSALLCAVLTLNLGVGALAFHDVETDSELSKSVSVLQEKGLVKGAGNDVFRPAASLTVADLSTFLGRIAGDSVSQTALPEGVTADGWSGGYVAWAKSLGLVDAAAGQYDALARDGVNAILANFCTLLGVETVSVDSAIEGGVTRGEAAAALATLAQADFDRLQGVTYTTVTEGQDWGPAVTKVVLNPGVALDAKSVTADKFAVSSVRTCPDVDYMTYEMTEPYPHVVERSVIAAYLSDVQGEAKVDGAFLTLELQIGPTLTEGSPFWFNPITSMNEYVEATSYLVASKATLTRTDGKALSLAVTTAEGNTGNATLLADDFDTEGKYAYTYDSGKRAIDLTYASWFPKENAAKASTPLIIWLHGMGEGGTDPNVAILGNKVVNLITDDIQKNFGATGAAVLAPQTPTMWLDTSGSRNMAMGTANSESYYTEALMSLIVDFVKQHPEIDASRLYIGGCSNGGYMTINMLISYPGVFAAAYPVCEPYSNDWLTEEKLQTLVNTPIWLTASKDDMVTIYEGEWDENPPYYYNVTKDENGKETPIYDYSNALFDRLLKAGNKDVHYSLFDRVLDTTGLYKSEDGTPYRYDGHWSWLYTLNNECVETIGGKEVSLFAWLATHNSTGELPTLPLDKKVYENPVTFYLVRHGETEYNVQGIMQGWTDSPLTENGVALSEQLGTGLKGIPFVAAYSSDSGRAVDTAKNVLAGRDATMTTTEALREMSFGEKDGKSSEGVYTEENMGYRFGVGFDDLGGETWEELGARMHAALEQAALEHRDEGGNILISTHGMSILATLYTLVPDAPGVEEQGEIDNCSVTVLEWDNGVYTLKTLNDTSYLK